MGIKKIDPQNEVNEEIENQENTLEPKTESTANESKQEVTLLLNDKNMSMVSYEEIQSAIGDGNSLLKKHLTEEVYNEYKDVKTASGTTLYDIVRSCLKHPTSKIGMYAGDAESYQVFEKLFVPTIEDFHSVDKDLVYNGELGPIKLDLHLDPEAYGDIRIRMGANLNARFPAVQNKEESEEIERQVTDVLLKNFGGQYFSAATTPSEQRDARQKK
jgi:hypothetical protein